MTAASARALESQPGTRGAHTTELPEENRYPAVAGRAEPATAARCGEPADALLKQQRRPRPRTRRPGRTRQRGFRRGTPPGLAGHKGQTLDTNRPN